MRGWLYRQVLKVSMDAGAYDEGAEEEEVP